MIVDDKGKIFEDRRKVSDRRKKNEKVSVERRKEPRRKNEK